MNLRTMVAALVLGLCAMAPVQADCHCVRFPVARTVVVETADLVGKTLGAVKTHVVEPVRELTSCVVKRVKLNACQRMERREDRRERCCDCCELEAPVFDGVVQTYVVAATN